MREWIDRAASGEAAAEIVVREFVKAVGGSAPRHHLCAIARYICDDIAPLVSAESAQEK